MKLFAPLLAALVAAGCVQHAAPGGGPGAGGDPVAGRDGPMPDGRFAEVTAPLVQAGELTGGLQVDRAALTAWRLSLAVSLLSEAVTAWARGDAPRPCAVIQGEAGGPVTLAASDCALDPAGHLRLSATGVLVRDGDDLVSDVDLWATQEGAEVSADLTIRWPGGALATTTFAGGSATAAWPEDGLVLSAESVDLRVEPTRASVALGPQRTASLLWSDGPERRLDLDATFEVTLGATPSPITGTFEGAWQGTTTFELTRGSVTGWEDALTLQAVADRGDDELTVDIEMERVPETGFAGLARVAVDLGDGLSVESADGLNLAGDAAETRLDGPMTGRGRGLEANGEASGLRVRQGDALPCDGYLVFQDEADGVTTTDTVEYQDDTPKTGWVRVHRERAWQDRTGALRVEDSWSCRNLLDARRYAAAGDARCDQP